MERSIFRVTKIPKEKQRGLTLTTQELFLCSIAFCHFYHEKFESKLESIVDLLKSMQENPDSPEWSIWERAVSDSYKTRVLERFEWNRELPLEN